GPRLEALEARDVPAAIGSLDPSFGIGGKVVADVGFDDHATALALAPDGKVVAVGFDTTTTFKNFEVVRLNPDGSFDTTFNGDGRGGVPGLRRRPAERERQPGYDVRPGRGREGDVHPRVGGRRHVDGAPAGRESGGRRVHERDHRGRLRGHPAEHRRQPGHRV